MSDNQVARPEWRSVVSFPNYAVSSDGQVKRVFRGGGYGEGARTRMRDLRPEHDKDGYLRVGLCNGLTHRHYHIHTLVLTAFIGPRPQGMEAAHRNGLPTDNRVENLMWTTHKQNCAHKVLHGTVRFGDNHPRVVYSDAVTTRVHELLCLGTPRKDIAAVCNVKLGFVHDVALGRRRVA